MNVDLKLSKDTEEPQTPGASTGASTAPGAEPANRENFDTSLPGSTVAVPPLWNGDGAMVKSFMELGR